MNHGTFIFTLLTISAILTTISEAADRDMSDANHVTQPERVYRLSKITERIGEATDHVKPIHNHSMRNSISYHYLSRSMILYGDTIASRRRILQIRYLLKISPRES